MNKECPICKKPLAGPVNAVKKVYYNKAAGKMRSYIVVIHKDCFENCEDLDKALEHLPGYIEI